MGMATARGMSGMSGRGAGDGLAGGEVVATEGHESGGRGSRGQICLGVGKGPCVAVEIDAGGEDEVERERKEEARTGRSGRSGCRWTIRRQRGGGCVRCRRSRWRGT